MEPYTTQNSELASPIGFFNVNGDIEFQHHVSDYFTQIDIPKRLNSRFKHLNKIDRCSYPLSTLRLMRFDEMSRFLFPYITHNERRHLYYYCKKYDKKYNKISTHIFYLALVSLGKFSALEAYDLYPFQDTLCLSTAFKIVSELNLYKKPNFKYKYLAPFLLDFPLPDRIKFIRFYADVYDRMIHTSLHIRVRYCLRLFYPEVTAYRLGQLFSINYNTIQISFNTFRRAHPKMAKGLFHIARAMRYD